VSTRLNGALSCQLFSGWPVEVMGHFYGLAWLDIERGGHHGEG